MAHTVQESRKERGVNVHVGAMCKSRLRRLPSDDDATNRELTCGASVSHHLRLHTLSLSLTNLVFDLSFACWEIYKLAGHDLHAQARVVTVISNATYV